ncbi:hypothetical protein NQ317_001498 [Molorchus minor]|uniref:Uncharacterized protein n=1 Tax=Molorchus minor TaxID=1323400 RepID=A0ABQ9IQH3_9CUCU|nr:hypothetical protein NQ317_001498 [Molorchus minor]
MEHLDKLRESFINTGDFFATSGVSRIDGFECPRRVNSLLNTIMWSLCTLLPISYYLIKLLFSGELLYFSVGAGIIGAFARMNLLKSTIYLLLNKTIGMSEIKKGSSYGTNTTPKKTQLLKHKSFSTDFYFVI